MTTRRFIGNPIYSADNTDPPVVNQRFQVTENFVLKSVRAYLILFNSPVFTDVKLKLYASRAQAPTKVIATSSNLWVPGDLQTLAYAFKEIYFTFSEVPLRSGTDYHLGMVISGYTGNAGSHLCWPRAWPDPPYKTGITVTQAKASVMPLSMTLLGSPLP